MPVFCSHLPLHFHLCPMKKKHKYLTHRALSGTPRPITAHRLAQAHHAHHFTGKTWGLSSKNREGNNICSLFFPGHLQVSWQPLLGFRQTPLPRRPFPPTLESPLRNFNQFHHAKERQTGSKYVFLQHEHKQCGNHHAPMVRRQVETTPRRRTQRYVRASSPHRRSRRYDRRCSACRSFRASQWSWKSHRAHPTVWSRRSASGRAGSRVASRRKL